MRNKIITEQHLDTCLKILSKEKWKRKEELIFHPSKREQQVKEMEYCERFVKWVFKEYDRLMKQPRLL